MKNQMMIAVAALAMVALAAAPALAKDKEAKKKSQGACFERQELQPKILDSIREPLRRRQQHP